MRSCLPLIRSAACRMPSVKRLIIVPCLLFVGSVFAAEREDMKLVFKNSEHDFLCLKSEDARFNAFRFCGRDSARFRADAKTSLALWRSDRLHPLIATKSANTWNLVVLSEVASTERGSTRFCGAGSEHELLLLSLTSGKVRVEDRVLVQSCLKGIALANDRGDDPRDALSISYRPAGITFRWVGDEEGRLRRITIEDHRFKLVEPTE